MAQEKEIFKMSENLFINKPIEGRKVLHKSDFLPGSVPTAALESNLFAIKIGTVADRPTDGTANRFYFATDESKLYYYDTSTDTWSVSVTFS